MRKSITAVDIMQELPYRLNTTDSLFKAGRMMKDHDFRHLPVMEGKELKGIVSETDYLVQKLKVGTDVEVGNVMSCPAKSLNESSSIDEIVDMFTEQRFRSVPVVDDRNYLKGIISSVDLIQFLRTNMDEL